MRRTAVSAVQMPTFRARPNAPLFGDGHVTGFEIVSKAAPQLGPRAAGGGRKGTKMTGKTGDGGRAGVPPPQHNLATARTKAVESLQSQSDEQMVWLGARRAGDVWRLPVLSSIFEIDTSTGQVRVDGEDVRPMWQILALHYLAGRNRPQDRPPETTFANLPAGRTYAGVYANRVNRRLCATAGRDRQSLDTAASFVGAQHVEGADAALEARFFPRVPLRLLWYAGDDELPPSCTLLLPATIESLLCVEDIVVMSECFVSRLSGGAF